jgi:hypothetical protein
MQHGLCLGRGERSARVRHRAQISEHLLLYACCVACLVSPPPPPALSLHGRASQHMRSTAYLNVVLRQAPAGQL